MAVGMKGLGVYCRISFLFELKGEQHVAHTPRAKVVSGRAAYTAKKNTCSQNCGGQQLAIQGCNPNQTWLRHGWNNLAQRATLLQSTALSMSQRHRVFSLFTAAASLGSLSPTHRSSSETLYAPSAKRGFVPQHVDHVVRRETRSFSHAQVEVHLKTTEDLKLPTCRQLQD